MFAISITTRIALCALSLVAVCGCQEVRTIHLRDYKAWQDLTVADKSWFPDIIPSTAHDINIMYDLDTSATNISFSASQEDCRKLESILVPLNTNKIFWPKMRGDKSWWPSALRNRSVDKGKKSELAFFSYSQPGDKQIFKWGCAINTEKSKVYFWY